jgi:hypothetical protein
MSGLIILLIFSTFSFFVAYQALRKKRFFWYAPTITGFKRRKEQSDDGFTQIIGVVMLISGILTSFIFIKGLFNVL